MDIDSRIVASLQRAVLFLCSRLAGVFSSINLARNVDLVLFEASVLDNEGELGYS